MSREPTQTWDFYDILHEPPWARVQLWVRPGKSILQETAALRDALTNCLGQMQHVIDHASSELCPHGDAWDDCPDCRH